MSHAISIDVGGTLAKLAIYANGNPSVFTPVSDGLIKRMDLRSKE